MKAGWVLCWLVGLVSLPASVVADGALLTAIDQYPDCAKTCFAASMPKSSCSVTDDKCLCSDQSMTAEVGVCVASGCSVRQGLFTQNLTMTLCGAPIRDKTAGYETMVITLLVIATLCVIQRLALRHFLKIGLGADDWVILLTMINVIINTIISLYGLGRNGFGRDFYTLTPDQITSFLKYFQISSVLYFSQITLLKISLLLFYLRIFPIKSVRYLLWGTIVFNVAFGITYVLLTIFMCLPFGYFWNMWDKEHTGKCLNLNAITDSNGAISIITDVWMLAIPLSQVHNLNLDWKKKIGVGLMFCIGTFVTIMSILRFREVLRFRPDNQNPTWDYMPIATWSVLEVDVGIICACMPAIRTLFAHFFSRVFGTIRKSGDESHMSSGIEFRNRKPKNSVILSEDSTEAHPSASHRAVRQNALFATSLSDTDEVRLVELRYLDKKSSKSDVSL